MDQYLSISTKKALAQIMAVTLLFSFTLGAFYYSKQIRKPSYEFLNPRDYASSELLFFAKNWYREGPVALKFGLYHDIKAIGNENVFNKSENLYYSYLPGNVMPIYIMAKWYDRQPDVAMLTQYNLFNHFFTTFLLSLIVFIVLRQIKFKLLYAFMLSLIPIYLELFLPGPLVYHHTVVSREHSAILPFAFYIFLEIAVESVKKEKYIKAIRFIQSLILFYGVSCSWFFISVALVTYLKRVFRHQLYPSFRASAYYWSPVIAAITLFVLQQYVIHVSKDSSLSFFQYLDQVKDHYMMKTSFAEIGNDYRVRVKNILQIKSPFVFAVVSPFTFLFYVYIHYKSLYGKEGVWLSAISVIITIMVAAYISRRYYLYKISPGDKVIKILSSISIILLPSILYCFLIRQHVTAHSSEVLRFSLFIATTPFILIPVLVYTVVNKESGHRLFVFSADSEKRLKAWIIIVSMIVLSASYLLRVFPLQETFLNRSNGTHDEIGKFILANTKYEDIVFSVISTEEWPGASQEPYNVSMFAVTEKKLYKFYSVKDIHEMVKIINKPYTINVLSSRPINLVEDSRVKHFISSVPHDIIRKGRFYLYKIEKNDFLSVCNSELEDWAQLIDNGGFDRSTSGWIPSHASKISSVTGGQSGNALKIELTSAATKGVYRAIKVEKGKKYTLTFYQKNGTAHGGYNIGYTHSGREIKASEDISNATWTQYSYTFESPENVVYIQFYTRRSKPSEDYSYIDTVTLQEVDSPLQSLQN